ncbi:MAG TPA: RsmD family RNA methyltransferase, partial [Microthrixaceae bacterium]|nr:RsmD family RNA methyltransferase [Microthrixaceae bacterium]
LVDATVLDLFAGSGALGIEALSRGAAHVTFVDSAAASLRAIEANLDRTRFGDRARVVRADASRHVEVAPSVDLALLDPPYEFDGWEPLLSSLQAAVIVVESDRPIALPPRYELRRDRRYGTTVVHIAQLQEHDR